MTGGTPAACPGIHTPDLSRTRADPTGVFGFTGRQHLPDVLALVAHGPMQLWACGAKPGRREKPDPRETAWAPARHRVVVRHPSPDRAMACPRPGRST
ncbi:hypothetical protein [Hydrogenophaga sp.]|uniref:hypothetical protein n=1 Tax=Hydrogenophaga sp. TaxID=1904254 RepID=UPI002735CD8C|nr:hypothetical protein [Hydrogenophaga sp.]MDP3887596.1 hypothetical protein [Hydrogenophaga sp.]